MTDDFKKLLYVLLAAAAVAVLLYTFVPSLLGAAAGPEVEILTTLKTAEAKGLALEVGDAGTLRSTRVSFDRISVVVSGQRATVTATLDFDGELLHTKVSSLGHEKVLFEHKASGDWEPSNGYAPELTGVVRALEDRRRGLESGDLSRLCFEADAGQRDLAQLLLLKGRGLRSTSWLIRNEREEVIVSEDYRLSGDLPDRPVDDMGSRRLKLQPTKDGEFCFPEGLM